MKDSYQAVNLLIAKIKKLSIKKRLEEKEFFIYGEKDEIYTIIVNTLNKLDVNYMSIHKIDKTNFSTDKQFLVLYWNPEYIEEVKKVKKYNDNVEFKNVLIL